MSKKILLVFIVALAFLPSVQAQVLQNTDVRFEFAREGQLLYLKEMQNLKTGRIFPTEKHDLIYFTIRKNLTNKTTYFLHELPHTFNFRTEVDAGKQTLFFDITNIDFGSGNTMNLYAAVVLHQGSPTAEFWINATTTMPDFSLYELTFPNVFFQELTTTKTEALIRPSKMGSLIINPRQTPLSNKAFRFLTGDHDQTYQFYAWYVIEDEEIIYTATHDPDAYFKYHILNVSPTGMGFTVAQVPENHLTYDIDYTAPYPFVIGAFSGDWYDAAQYYRAWAVPHFVPRGKLEFSSEVSPLVHEFDLRATFGVGGDDPIHKPKFSLLVQEVTDFQNFFNECPDPRMPEYSCNPNYTIDNVSVELYHWHNNSFELQTDWPLDYKPIQPVVRQAVKDLQDRGHYVFPYTIALTFDQLSPSYNSTVEGHGNINESGGIVTVQNLTMETAPGLVMDPSTSWWQGFVAGIMLDHTDFGDDDPSFAGIGFDGAYWDVFSASASRADYSTDRGHPQGGGKYWTQGNKDLVELSRTVAKTRKPHWFQESEHASELFANDFEYFQWDDAAAFFHPIYNIPLFPTLYHDYVGITTIVAGWPNVTSFLEASNLTHDYANMILGLYYTYGMTPPIANSHLNDSLTFPLGKEEYKFHNFQKKIVRSYSFTKKHILYGQRLRDLEISVGNTDLGLPILAPNLYFKNHYPKMPYVLPSVWKANDETIGIMLINWWNESAPVSFTFNLTKYGLPPNKYYLYDVNEVGRTLVGEYNDTFIFSRTIENRSVGFFHLTDTPTQGEQLRYSGNSFDLQAGSFEVWIQPSWSGADTGTWTFFDYAKSIAPINRLHLWAQSGQLHFQVDSEGSSPSSMNADISSWRSNEWHHVLVTWSVPDGEAKLYIDFVEQASMAYSSPPKTLQDFYVGTQYDGTFPLDAVIDELRVSRKVRDPQSENNGYGFACSVSGQAAVCGDVKIIKTESEPFFAVFQENAINPGQSVTFYDTCTSEFCQYRVSSTRGEHDASIFC